VAAVQQALGLGLFGLDLVRVSGLAVVEGAVAV
jgi:hypothetical protein